MGIKYWFLFFVLLLLLGSCGSSNNLETKVLNNDSTLFFSCNNFILTDIKDVEETPYFIYKITTKNKKDKDSVTLTPQQFKSLANYFLLFDVTDKKMKPFYTETSFQDLTTNSFPIVYNAVNDTCSLRSETFLFDKDNKDHLKTILFHRMYSKGDTDVIEHMQWKFHQSFSISTIKKYQNKTDEQVVLVNWNDKKVFGNIAY